jgi:D-threo-aldose 1-dehydrogenase
MQRRTTGRGLGVTELGFGAAQLGNLFVETTDEEAAAAVDAAWDAGIRYFDTAPHYGLGLSERRLGAALASRNRDDYLVSTKVGRLLVPSPATASIQDDGGFVVPAATRREWNFTRDGILRSFEQSLTRLGLDRVDIAYLHDPDDHWQVASTEGIATLIELRDQGLVRSIGAGMNQAAMTADFIRQCDVDIMMLAGRLTLLDHAVDDLLPLAAERGVGIVAAGVYNSGLLGKARPDTDARFEYEQASPDLIARTNAIADVCESYGVSLPEVALAYPLRSPAVVSVVLGMRTAAQVDSNIDRYETPIPEELWGALHSAGLLS